jgi:hypothetical protein
MVWTKGTLVKFSCKSHTVRHNLTQMCRKCYAMQIIPNLLHDSFCSTLSRYMRYLTTLTVAVVTQHWWNDADRGKLKYWENAQSHCHSINHKSNMEWAQIEPGPLWWQTDMQLSEPWHNLLSSLSHGTTYCQHLQSKNLTPFLWSTSTCITPYKTNCNTHWALTMLHIQDAPGSNLSPQTSYPHCSISCFSSVPPDRGWDITSNQTRSVLRIRPSPLFPPFCPINYPLFTTLHNSK